MVEEESIARSDAPSSAFATLDHCSAVLSIDLLILFTAALVLSFQLQLASISISLFSTFLALND